jgi:hypothetical protein
MIQSPWGIIGRRCLHAPLVAVVLLGLLLVPVECRAMPRMHAIFEPVDPLPPVDHHDLADPSVARLHGHGDHHAVTESSSKTTDPGNPAERSRGSAPDPRKAPPVEHAPVISLVATGSAVMVLMHAQPETVAAVTPADHVVVPDPPPPRRAALRSNTLVSYPADH